MKTSKNIGLIECGSGRSFKLDSTSSDNGFNVMKVLNKNISAELARSQYPLAEIVEDQDSIIHDATIDLVIVSSPDDDDLGVVAAALGAGKQVRVV